MAGTTADQLPVTEEDVRSCLNMLEGVKKSRNLQAPVSELPDSATDEERSDYTSFQALSTRSPHRREMTTKQGYVGIGPTVAQPGDIVVVAYGSQWPC
jgi:hypothetical protein